MSIALNIDSSAGEGKLNGMQDTLWPRVIGALPAGLTVGQTAKFFRRSEKLMYRRLKAAGYKPSSTPRLKFPNWVNIADWGLPNIVLAEAFGVSRERVRQVRKILGKPLVESRGGR